MLPRLAAAPQRMFVAKRVIAPSIPPISSPFGRCCPGRIMHTQVSILGTAAAAAAAPPPAAHPLPAGKILPILTYPNDILRTKCKDVEAVTDEVRQLVADMLATVADDGSGIGLAAPQVGATVRVFVVRRPLYKNDYEYKATTSRLRKQGRAAEIIPSTGFIACINPRILTKSEATDVGLEACLSIPDFHALVRRRMRIDVEYTSITGQLVREQLHALPAVVFQHELDHLDGVLLSDREAIMFEEDRDAAMSIAQEKWFLGLMKYYGEKDLK